jgi:hypothetical protein
VSFAMQKFLNLMQSPLSILALLPELLGSSVESPCLYHYLKVFASRSFKVSGFTLRSLI